MPQKKNYKRTIAPNRRLFAKVAAETGNLKLAYASAYKVPMTALPSEVEERGKEVASRPDVRMEILRVWEDMGLTLSLASSKHLKVLKSRRARASDVLNAVNMVYKMHGAGDEKEGKSSNSILNLFITQRQERGLEIPAEILEVKGEGNGGEPGGEEIQVRAGPSGGPEDREDSDPHPGSV